MSEKHRKCRAEFRAPLPLRANIFIWMELATRCTPGYVAPLATINYDYFGKLLHLPILRAVSLQCSSQLTALGIMSQSHFASLIILLCRQEVVEWFLVS